MKQKEHHLQYLVPGALVLLLMLFIPSLSAGQQSEFLFTDQALELAAEKLRLTAEELSFDSGLYPSQTDPETGRWDTNHMRPWEWTSGFYAGSLWYMYRLTGDEEWKDYAIHWTESLEKKAYETEDHDTGFRIMSSFGNGYDVLRGRYYHRVLIQAAHTLARRYDENIGAIKSWDWFRNFPVIIDNIMNIELLFRAAELHDNNDWYEIAVQHANTTLRHLKRPDASFYHIVDFDENGGVAWKGTVQGFGEQSAWARGQAWALYGFTMVYRFTGDARHLDAATAAADFYIHSLPEDFVPIYDFREPIPSAKTKDASAAAIAASGLLELYSHTGNTHYLRTAEATLNSLASDTYSTYHTDKSSILTQTTIKRDVANLGTVYADYYYLEAIYRYKNLNHQQRLSFFSRQEAPRFYLDQNYPNPFNNHTRIFYSIEEEGPASLSIYDIHGRRVKRVANRHHTPGTYNITIDASSLASGTYLYRLQSSGTVQTRKMILIK